MQKYERRRSVKEAVAAKYESEKTTGIFYELWYNKQFITRLNHT